MAKKLTKQELEQDPLIDSYEKVQDFYVENKNLIITSVIAILLAIGLSIGYYYYSQSQENKAQQLMAYAEQYYLNGNYEAALRGSEEDFTVGFEQIINNYSGTKAGNLALYYAAVSEYNLGNIDQALTYINDFEPVDGILGVGPLSFKGVLLTELGKHEDAAQAYIRAANWDKNTSTTPYNLMEAAHAFKDAGNLNQARVQAEEILNEYPSSDQETSAQRLLGMLQTTSR